MAKDDTPSRLGSTRADPDSGFALSVAKRRCGRLTGMPKTLATEVTSELIIKKSRFIGCVRPVAGREEALQVVAGLRRAHANANHVCWALLAGGQSAAVDDGEPGGTAGRPMLEVLRHQDLEGVLATVVRYFGGVKLGAGGLVRAYTDCVAQALLGAQKVDMVRARILQCEVPYALEGMVRRALERSGATQLTVTHAQSVAFRFSLPDDTADALMRGLGEACGGKLAWIGDDAP